MGKINVKNLCIKYNFKKKIIKFEIAMRLKNLRVSTVCVS